MLKCQMYYILVWALGILHLLLNTEIKLIYRLLVNKT